MRRNTIAKKSYEPDKPMFDPDAWELTKQQTDLTALARKLGQEKFAGRAEKWDREAIFPMANYKDMHKAGLLGICIPKKYKGIGADQKTYALTAAEIGRYCGATALTYNMHVSSCLWTGTLVDDLPMPAKKRREHNSRRAIHYERILKKGAIYAQPFSEGGAAAAGFRPFGTKATRVDGGWLINGKKIFASLAGSADYYGILCTEEKENLSRKDTMYLAVPAKATGITIEGDWDPLGMRGTVSRNLIFENVFVPDDAALMPKGIYFEAAVRWPHMFTTLTPSYMGIAQAAYDFTVKYLRGEMEGTPPVKRRMYPTKQHAVAEMLIMLEQTKSIWFQMLNNAKPNPNKDEVLRAYCAQYSVMENSNKLAQLAIRTCGGQSMLKSLPLERLYRDSRCGSLMLPWTAELCLDKLGRESLYERGEEDN
jgi:alkylation response protein AidB-like acyl-CoA dehydrogenase